MRVNWWLKSVRRSITFRAPRMSSHRRQPRTLQLERLEDRTLLNAGALDPTFGSGGFATTPINTNAIVNSVIVQPDAKIVAGGVSTANNIQVFSLARYNSNGTLDSTFGKAGIVTTAFGTISAAIEEIALQSDGKIVAAGTVASTPLAIGGQFGVARYNANGTLDSTFGSGGQVTVSIGGLDADRVAGVVIAKDGSIIVAGITNFLSPQGQSEVALASFTPSGGLNPNFGIGGIVKTTIGTNADVGDVALQSDGKIVVVGGTNTSASIISLFSIRYSPTGAVDSTFGNAGSVLTTFGQNNVNLADGVAIQPNGQIVIDATVSQDVSLQTPNFVGVTRLNSSGSVDTSFGTNGQTIVTSVASDPSRLVIQNDGKIVVSGTSQPTGPSDFTRAMLVRFNFNGTVDTTFAASGIFQAPDSGGNSTATDVTVQEDGKLVGCGAATINNTTVFAVGRFISINSVIVTGADAGGGPNVVVFDGVTNAVKLSFFAYDPAFVGGVRVALGDVNGDGISEIITGPGPGGGPDIRIFNLSTGALISQFFAFNPLFAGGVYLGTGDVNDDGRDDIVVGADAGGGPNVVVFSGKDNSLLFSFFAFDPAFTGGVRAAAGDTNLDGRADIITGAGPGGGPNVLIFNPATLTPISSFFAFSPAFNGGIYVASGDLNGDQKADVVVGAGPGAGPNVAAFNATGVPLFGFFPYNQGFAGGVRVASGDLTSNRASIITAAGPGGGPDVRAFDGTSAAQIDQFFAYNTLFSGGLYVAAGI